jgi:hypothetical protein
MATQTCDRATSHVEQTIGRIRESMTTSWTRAVEVAGRHFKPTSGC